MPGVGSRVWGVETAMSLVRAGLSQVAMECQNGQMTHSAGVAVAPETVQALIARDGLLVEEVKDK